MSEQADPFTQCKLKRGNTSQTAWIPAKFATVGATLCIRENGRWQDGYVVAEKYQTMSKSAINEVASSRGCFVTVLDGHC